MKKIVGAFAALVVVIVIAYVMVRNPEVSVVRSEGFETAAMTFQQSIVARFNDENAVVTVGGNAMDGFSYDFYVSDNMKLMVETEFLRRLIGCSVVQYKTGDLIIMKGDNSISLEIGSSKAKVNDTVNVDLGDKVLSDDDAGKIYVPIDNIAEYINYQVNYDADKDWIDMTRLSADEKMLPAAYDMRDYGRVSAVRDQERYGTCWAFASLGAFESTLLPMEQYQFSTDHMTMQNSYNLDTDQGGEAAMSIAYLAAWQGPVYESDDPYGDGVSTANLTAVKHLEEAIVIKDRDLETIKSAVFRYGGAETSLYSQLAYVDSVSVYYSEENYSYYYDGDEEPNHDVVIVGWDDNYSKSNFTIEPPGDGAFICKNSWGEEFGDGGYFYVSYYDTNLCNSAIIYSRIGDVDDYDNL
jgi:C1A family cysteine protease